MQGVRRVSRRAQVASPLADVVRGCRTVVLDCDGVIWRGTRAVPGAAAFIQSAWRLGKRVVFLTNNSTKSTTTYVRKLKAVLDLDVDKAHIISSATAAALLLRKRGVRRAYVVGERGLCQELAEQGIASLGGPQHSDAEAGPFDLGGFSRGQVERFDEQAASVAPPEAASAMPVTPPPPNQYGIQAVVAGFDGTFNYRKLCFAASLARRASCPFVATNLDANFPAGDLLIPGGGTMVQAIATSLGREPDAVAGKPSAALLDLLRDVAAAGGTGEPGARMPQLESEGPDAELGPVVMVGDRLDTDIQFGNQPGLGAGMASVLVMSGVTSEPFLQSTCRKFQARTLDDAEAGAGSGAGGDGEAWPLTLPRYVVPSIQSLSDAL